MANDDRPWWSKNHTLWGGETFKSAVDRPRLGIKEGDRFRIEKGSNKKITLIPHPHNVGTWKDTHDKSNPIKLTTFSGTNNERAFSMMVTTAAGGTPTKLFLIERQNGTVAITENADDPGENGGTAAVER